MDIPELRQSPNDLRLPNRRIGWHPHRNMVRLATLIPTS